MKLQDTTIFFYCHADAVALLHRLTKKKNKTNLNHQNPLKPFHHSLISTVCYILEENFMMKYYGPYENYISICSLSFLCPG